MPADPTAQAPRAPRGYNKRKMEMYMKFWGTLAVGLLGAGFVLKTLLDELFQDWDAWADLKAWVRAQIEGASLKRMERAEDVMLEIENAKRTTSSTRLLDKRREQLREIELVEHRLSQRDGGPIVLTPLPPPPVRSAD